MMSKISQTKIKMLTLPYILGPSSLVLTDSATSSLEPDVQSTAATEVGAPARPLPVNGGGYASNPTSTITTPVHTPGNITTVVVWVSVGLSIGLSIYLSVCLLQLDHIYI